VLSLPPSWSHPLQSCSICYVPRSTVWRSGHLGLQAALPRALQVQPHKAINTQTAKRHSARNAVLLPLFPYAPGVFPPHAHDSSSCSVLQVLFIQWNSGKPSAGSPLPVGPIPGPVPRRPAHRETAVILAGDSTLCHRTRASRHAPRTQSRIREYPWTQGQICEYPSDSGPGG